MTCGPRPGPGPGRIPGRPGPGADPPGPGGGSCARIALSTSRNRLTISVELVSSTRPPVSSSSSSVWALGWLKTMFSSQTFSKI